MLDAGTEREREESWRARAELQMRTGGRTPLRVLATRLSRTFVLCKTKQEESLSALALALHITFSFFFNARSQLFMDYPNDQDYVLLH